MIALVPVLEIRRVVTLLVLPSSSRTRLPVKVIAPVAVTLPPRLVGAMKPIVLNGVAPLPTLVTVIDDPSSVSAVPVWLAEMSPVEVRAPLPALIVTAAWFPVMRPASAIPELVRMDAAFSVDAPPVTVSDCSDWFAVALPTVPLKNVPVPLSMVRKSGSLEPPAWPSPMIAPLKVAVVPASIVTVSRTSVTPLSVMLVPAVRLKSSSRIASPGVLAVRLSEPAVLVMSLSTMIEPVSASSAMP